MEFFLQPNTLFYLAAYLIGSIPFGLLLAKIFTNINIKNYGSNSIGATNVLRVLSANNPLLAKKLAISTAFLDALKGFLVLFIAWLLNAPLETLWTIAVLSVVGHCYSIYLFFEGGKGIAVGLGVLLFLTPISALIGIFIWAFCAKVLKISSISSLIGLIGVIVSTLIIYDGLEIDSNVPLYFISFIIIYKHIPNLIRLFKGQESKAI